MQTACYWQFCFSDRLTGARNPARLSIAIQSRRSRCAPMRYLQFNTRARAGCAWETMDRMPSKLGVEALVLVVCGIVALRARIPGGEWPRRLELIAASFAGR